MKNSPIKKKSQGHMNSVQNTIQTSEKKANANALHVILHSRQKDYFLTLFLGLLLS